MILLGKNKPSEVIRKKCIAEGDDIPLLVLFRKKTLKSLC